MPTLTAVLALLLIGAVAGNAAAKPIVAVSASFDPEDRDLRAKFAQDLNGLATPEDFLARQFIAEFSTLGVFDFVHAPYDAATQLTLRVSSGAGPQRWPSADAELAIKVAGAPPVTMPLFARAYCGLPPCSPPTLADPEWYRRAFTRVIQQWPSGLFKTIALTRTASYQRGGKIRTVESVREFGQRSGELPTALFELLVGDYQVPVALCLDVNVQHWRGLGRDQGRGLPSTFQPTCWPAPVDADIPSIAGTLTLVRVFR